MASDLLAELRTRLTGLECKRRQPPLRKPQVFLMDIGDVLAYPTSRGKCINSYFASKERISGWKQDGWSAAVIVDLGRAFDFLAWYRPLVVMAALVAKPTLTALLSTRQWTLGRPGTCSGVHFKRMELEKIGTLPIDGNKLKRTFPTMPSGIYQAVNDISIVNELSVPKEQITSRPGGRKYAVISGLTEILSA
jgi:hypothetical protein